MITIEIYFVDPYCDVVVRQPKDMLDALDFVERALADTSIFSLYVDKNDSEQPIWQMSFCLLGCQNKLQAMDFVQDIWHLL